MLLPSRLGCPLSRKTPNMGNTGSMRFHPTGRGHEDDEDGQPSLVGKHWRSGPVFAGIIVSVRQYHF